MQLIANLRHLAALLEINRLGSINKAAEAVHLSQSALTQGLSKIEADLGQKLFDRSTSGMYANTAGEILLARLERAFQYFKGVENELSQGKKRHRPAYHSLSVAQLRALISVVEEGNISLAAAKLSLAQPTVQRAVRDIEPVCGQQLFIRSATGVDPTPIAKKLAKASSLAFTEIQAGVDELRQAHGIMQGRLVIGSLPLARTALVPESVTRLLQRYPELQVSIVDGPYEELAHGLTHGKIDIIIGAVRRNLSIRELQQESLFDDELAVIVRRDHPLLAKRHLSLKNLNSLDWIAPRPQTPSRSRFKEIFEHQNLAEPHHIIECSSSVAIRGLLLRSDRLALLSKRQVKPDMDAGYLAALPLTLENSARTIGLTTRRNWRPTRAQRDYLTILRDVCNDSSC